MDTSADLMGPVEDEFATNKRAWDIAASKFIGCCALPDWGPFSEGRNLDLLGPLSGLTVMEVGCGSGHSIARAIELGSGNPAGFGQRPVTILFRGEGTRDSMHYRIRLRTK